MKKTEEIREREVVYREKIGDRTITVCLIVDEETATRPTIIAAGMAICSPKDNFSEKIGRRIASGRARKALEASLTAAERVETENGTHHLFKEAAMYPTLREEVPLCLPRIYKGYANFMGMEPSSFESRLLEKISRPVAA